MRPGNASAAWTAPGRRNQIVVIQTRTDSTGTYGDPVHSWAAFATVWAYVRPLRGRELVAAQAAQNMMEFVFNIRWISGIVPAMRIVYNGKNYDITAVVDIDEARREIDIMAKTGLSAG